MEIVTEKDFSSQNLEHFYINKYVLLLTITQQHLKAFILMGANQSYLGFFAYRRYFVIVYASV